jgi:outer membrane protein assembly factor BamB
VSRLGKSDVKGTPLSPLPGPRADAAAVSIGRTAYVVGGYGAHSDRAVLSTSDGRSYHKVANLPVPVRYPAVTTWRGNIYVFGGETVYGPRPGVASRAVQVVDPASHSATLAGRLPVAVEGAAAATLDGVMYLAGGQSPSGTAAGSHGELSSIYAWSPQRRRALLAGHLFLPVSHAGLAVLGSRAWLIGGETAPGAPTSAVQMFEPNSRFGTAGKPGAGSPYYGDKLMIADRGNNRLLVLDDTGRIIWKYPSPGRPAPPGGFYFPDDAFFADHGRQIISNQEENDTLVRLGYPSGKVLWTYGHPRQPGSRPGYLDNPDDAYLLKNGDVTVADPMNCRVLVLSKRSKILTQIGTPGMCLHEAGRYLGSPNGDTPLSDGDLLVSEINGAWIDEYTLRGHLVWAVKLPIAYPSDPQPISRNKFLVADYEHPGLFLEFNRSGKILYRYGPTSGPGELNRPSLVERLPSGVLMANDDYNDRMMAIDPATGALVWQYGKTERPGTAYGFLNQPDGFDLLGPNRTYPTHPATG